MKFRITLLLLFAINLILQGQKITESAKGMNLGTNNSFTISFPDYDKKMVETVWKDFTKDFKGRTKNVKRSNELFTDNAEVESISPNPIDLYVDIASAGSGSEMTLWVDLGGIFINSTDHPKQFSGVERLLKDFGSSVKVAALEEELDMEEKNLSSLERDLNKLTNLNEKYYKQIEDWKKAIAENERLIEENDAEQLSKQAEIDRQLELVKELETRLEKSKN